MENLPKLYLYKRIVQAKLFIDKNYYEKIDLNNIADEASFSKFHFIRLFKTIYGKTPHNYLIQVRIDNAKDLLQKKLSIAEVCELVGFESTTSFTGLFKKLVGQSPSKFQQEKSKRKLEIENQPLQFIPNCFAETHGWTKNSNFQEVVMK